MNKISGLIICKNEESNIEDCIKSLMWCDEVVVLDAYSTDRTPEISAKYNTKFFQSEWKGFARQRELALTLAGFDWILSLDADERCSDELRQEIIDVMKKGEISEHGFEIPRKSFFLGKWIKHGGWYPNYQMRLFRKDKVRVTDRLVHESYRTDGNTGRLRGNILHYTVTSVREYMEKINTYSDLSAAEKKDRKRIGIFSLLIAPQIAFFVQYILKGNFLDGVEGLMVARFHMITKILNNMKIRELQKGGNISAK